MSEEDAPRRTRTESRGSVLSRSSTSALKRARTSTPNILARAATGSLFASEAEDPGLDDGVVVPESEASLMKSLRASTPARDQDAPEPLSITWKDVSFSVRVVDPESSSNTMMSNNSMMNLPILETNSGHVEGGSLVAFMGPSGCGKSTLLDIISKKKTAKYEGTVYLNGTETDKHYGDIMAYVGQEDLMHQFMTVGEVVKFTAQLKNPSGKGPVGDIDIVLEEMGLLHVKKTRIGGPAVRGISGGQRRRVSLARGVVSDAHLMFLDEPTSGLSSTDAELCVRVLKNMAEKYGITILVVIHQPRVEVARLFDQLILLCARPGRIVYDGPMNEVAEYFARLGHPVPPKSNFADHVLDVVTPGVMGADPDAFAEWYQEKLLPGIKQNVEAQLAAPSTTSSCAALAKSQKSRSFIYEFKVVFARELSLVRHDKRVVISSIVVSWIKSLLLGVMFQGVGNTEPAGVPQLSFMYVIMLVISLGAMDQIVRLIEVRDIMQLEVDMRLYGHASYILASSIVQFVLAALGSTVFLVTMFLFSGLEASTFLPLFGWSSLVFMVFISFTALIAAASKNQPAAATIAMPGILLMVMVSGFYISKVSAPVYLEWMLYVSPVALGMEMLAKDVYADNPLVWSMLHATYGYDENASALYFVCICVGYSLVFRIGQALALVYLHRIQR